MAPKPTDLPTWATDSLYPAGTDPWSGTDTKTEPTAGEQAEGWVPGEKPPAQFFNWWMNLTYLWTAYLDGQDFEGDVNIQNDLDVGGVLDVASDANVGTELAVQGTVNLNIASGSTDIHGNAIIRGDAEVRGDIVGDSGGDGIPTLPNGARTTAGYYHGEKTKIWFPTVGDFIDAGGGGSYTNFAGKPGAVITGDRIVYVAAPALMTDERVKAVRVYLGDTTTGTITYTLHEFNNVSGWSAALATTNSSSSASALITYVASGPFTQQFFVKIDVGGGEICTPVAVEITYDAPGP